VVPPHPFDGPAGGGAVHEVHHDREAVAGDTAQCVTETEAGCDHPAAARLCHCPRQPGDDAHRGQWHQDVRTAPLCDQHPVRPGASESSGRHGPAQRDHPDLSPGRPGQPLGQARACVLAPDPVGHLRAELRILCGGELGLQVGEQLVPAHPASVHASATDVRGPWWRGPDS